MNMKSTSAKIVAFGGALGGLVWVAVMGLPAKGTVTADMKLITTGAIQGPGDGPAIADHRSPGRDRRPVHPRPVADPSYLEAIHRTAAMVGDSDAQQLA